jgi:excisionase family DNA binding protein
MKVMAVTTAVEDLMTIQFTSDQVAALLGLEPADITVPQLAALAKMSESTIYRKVGSGEIRSYRLGERGIRIPASETRAVLVKSAAPSGDAGTHDRTGSNQDLVTKTGWKAHVAYLIPDEDLLTKADKHTLSYAELAALRQRAKAGDASAAIALAKLPAGEQRLADMLVKSFGGKVGKAKVAKSAKKAAKTRQDALSGMMRADLHSDDPFVREAARKALSGV